MSTITKLDKNTENEVIHFLVGFAGFSWEAAESFALEQPYFAHDMAKRIQASLLEDRSLTDELKEEVKGFKL